MKKISTIFLLETIVACFLFGVPTFANEVDGNDPEPVGEEYAGISNLSFNLSISNAGNATIHFTLGVTSGYSADYELILLRDNMGTWDEYSSWSGTLTGYRNASKTKRVVANYDYQAILHIDVYDADGFIADEIDPETAVVSY